MTKIINKKALLVLLTLALAFCWLVVPASAEMVNDNSDYIAEGVSITRTDSVASPQWGGSIYILTFEEVTVKAFGGFDSKGKPIGVEINDSYGYAEGPAEWLYCTIPVTFYEGMIDGGFNQFYCQMTFSLYGTDITRYIVKIDDNVIVDTEFERDGEYTVSWVSPRKPDTEFCVIAETISTKATIDGRMRVG